MDQVGSEKIIDEAGMKAYLSKGYGINYPVRHGQVENWVREARFNGPDVR